MREIEVDPAAGRLGYSAGVTYTSAENGFGLFAVFVNVKDANLFWHALTDEEQAATEVVKLVPRHD
jgi:hypothetical protein